MKAKCIRLFTLNLYVLYFLLLCIRKGLTITTTHGKSMHHELFRHERPYKSSGFQSKQQQHPSQHSPTTGINEAIHAFHPSNNLHLLHYMRSLTTTTTTRKPFTTRPMRHNHFILNPSKPIDTSHNNHFSSLKFQHQPPFRHTTLMSPSTVAPEYVHRNSLTHNEHAGKSNKVENVFFTTTNYGTAAIQQSTALSKPSAAIHSITKIRTQIHSTPQPRPMHRGRGEQDDYFNEFNEKNYRSNTFGAKNYGEVIADGNRGKEMNSKNVINDDDDDDNEDVEEVEDDDDEDDEEYDDYLDDESRLEESGQTGSLTEEKWENFGTREAVDKSRSQITHRSYHEMAVHNATAHLSRIYMEALCKIPKPKIIQIVDMDASKTYAPHCTVLHRCGDDTGCCNTDDKTCVPKRTATVDLYFYSYTRLLLHSVDHKLSLRIAFTKAKMSQAREGYECSVCAKSFTRKENYTNHQLWHTGKSPHKCFVCGKSYTKSGILDKHLKSHLPKEVASTSDKSVRAKFQCDFCPKIYSRKQYLKDHISIHNQESEHKCLYCGKMFTRKEHLVNHARSHTGDTPFKCEHCTKQFKLKKQLKAHMAVHRKVPRIFVCYICSKPMTRQSSVTNHINRSHSADGSYKCNECGKSFVVRSNLMFHMKSHRTL